MAPQNQGTVALLTAGKVHILAPVARSFGRNPPCYPGDRKVKALRSPLDPFTVSVWMKIGDWSQNRDFGGNGTEFVMGFKFVHVLTSNHSTTSPYISIVGSCLNTVNSGVCEGLGFPSLKKTHTFLLTHFVSHWFFVFPTSIKGPGHVTQKMCEACPDTI